MKIDLYIDGEQKTFIAPFIPMLARRKYYQLMAESEKKETEELTSETLLNEEDELHSILSDIVFKGQFTLDQLYEGASKPYVDDKLREAIFGVEKKVGKEGNGKGE